MYIVKTFNIICSLRITGISKYVFLLIFLKLDVIPGIDSRYNDGTTELINYLLFGFFDVRKDELDK